MRLYIVNSSLLLFVVSIFEVLLLKSHWIEVLMKIWFVTFEIYGTFVSYCFLSCLTIAKTNFFVSNYVVVLFIEFFKTSFSVLVHFLYKIYCYPKKIVSITNIYYQIKEKEARLSWSWNLTLLIHPVPVLVFLKEIFQFLTIVHDIP
jgi:hypothetical protein